MAKRLLVFLLVVVSAMSVKAQSDFDFTQRWFNPTLYNPATVGNNLNTNVFLLGRQQWAGFNKAPSTFAGTFDTYVSNIRSGFGVTVATDKVGLADKYNVRLLYAFYIKTGAESTLSLGLSAGLLVDSKHASNALIVDPSDPELAYADRTEYSPDFDFGIEYKGPVKAGISVRHLGAISPSNIYTKYSISVWAYLSAQLNISRGITVEPIASGIYRHSIYMFEGGALFYMGKTNSRDTYNNRFWIGGVLRTGSTVAAMAGAYITSMIRLGYSFDYGFGKIANLNNYGSHELFVAFKFDSLFGKSSSRPAYFY